MLTPVLKRRFALLLASSALAILVAATATAQQGVARQQKISDTAGNFAGELDDYDAFSVPARLGDLDGDGSVDLAVGARLDDDGGMNRGAVWILKVDRGGRVRNHTKISDTEGGFTGALDDNDAFGRSVEPLWCLTEEWPQGSAIAVGDEGDDDGGRDAGAVWLLLLTVNGSVSSHGKISATAGNFTGDLAAYDRFGTSLASLGDLDGDGVTDLAVGAPGDDDGGVDRGAVWILLLNADGTVKTHQKISDTEGGLSDSSPGSSPLGDHDHFGVSLACPGDVDGDGITDLAVGANSSDHARGGVWILFLNGDGTVKRKRRIGHGVGGFAGRLRRGDQFGWSLTEIGDRDREGSGDLAVGAVGDDDGGPDRGAVWLLTLSPDGSVRSERKISGRQGGFTGSLDDDDRFGSAIAMAGDVNGDGIPDLAVGAMGDDDGGTDRGAIWILFLDHGHGNPTKAHAGERSGLLVSDHITMAAPNPFNPHTVIHYELASRGRACIHIYDVAGRLVREFELGVQPAGSHAVQWDGLDASGRSASAGTYLVRLDTLGSRDTIRVSLIK
jgi:hypothetical protein